MLNYYFVVVKLTVILCYFIDKTFADAPSFVSGFGLTVLSSTQLNIQLYEVVVSSEEVHGNQTIRILVPNDYATSGSSRRYPVLYLLHGATDSAVTWTTKGAAQSICSNSSLIAVMPNGDPFGFYTNWVMPGNSPTQNWRTYHMEQLVPWIDRNLRTVAKKQGRAIAGNSMGGYGTIHYAELYSDNFIYAASFSGVLDLLEPRLQNAIINLPGGGNPLYGPFGYPSAPLSSNGWFAQSTTTHIAELHDIYIALYTGNIGGLETIIHDCNYHVRDLLTMFSIPVYFDDYEDGQSIGHGCNGQHNWLCFNAALIDVLPRMMAVLQQQY